MNTSDKVSTCTSVTIYTNLAVVNKVTLAWLDRTGDNKNHLPYFVVCAKDYLLVLSGIFV